ncbi:DUF2332 domain-containing protein [Ornithinimicrobium sp. Arc0846-15]|nr:DUF2332 domain-containing protein [Ornithinimicrobium laminariae]
MSEDLDGLQALFADFGQDMTNTAPLYAWLARSVAQDPEVAGLLLANDNAELRVCALFFAAVHNEILIDPSVPIASYYRSVTAKPRDDDPWPTFREFCLERSTSIRRTIATRTTQTNEIGRCALFLPALGIVADEVGPLSLLDVGTSAGLNLNLDRYSYRYQPGSDLDPSAGVSAAVLPCEANAATPIPPALPTIAARRGLDQSPVDVRDPAQARWLQACVWPEKPERFTRLAAALEISRGHPLAVFAGDAIADVAAQAREAASEGHPVVLNSWVLNYLSGAQRNAYLEQLDLVGAELDLTWLFAESPKLAPELPFGSDPDKPEATHLVLVCWRSSVRSVEPLAICHPHGAWISWRGSSESPIA